MESSRNSSSSELPQRVAAALSQTVPQGAHLALGLSGGVDSVALLSILLELAPTLRFSLRAVHVNHGISPNAGRWAEFCSDLCRKSGSAADGNGGPDPLPQSRPGGRRAAGPPRSVRAPGGRFRRSRTASR